MLLFFAVTSCETKDNYIDTGVAIGKHDCSIYQYLHKSSYDWDSTILLIQRAEMVEVFDGTEPITFWGPTNQSIRRYIMDKKLKCVADIPVKTCQDLLKMYISPGKYMTKDIAFQIPDINGKILGGRRMPTMSENIIHAYKQQGDYGGIEGVGAIKLFARSIVMASWGEDPTTLPIASPDIECTNGVVHSINYNHKFGNF